MYFKNISDEDLKQFHPVKTRDFIMSLTDILDSNLFKVENHDGIYRIFPLFYCNSIKSNNPTDNILENRCIIASKINNETYFTFSTDGSDDLPVIQSSFLNDTFKDLNDNLTDSEYNKLVYLLRDNCPFYDSIRLNKLVKGDYGVYHFRTVNDDVGTVLDKGILLSDSLKENGLQVMLSDPLFHYSRYMLHLKIYDFGDGDIPFDGDLSNASVTDLSVELSNGEYVDIQFPGDYRYAVIGIDAYVEILHDKPVIPDVINSVDLTGIPDIIQSGEFSEFYATGYDNGCLPVGVGHVIHFFEKIEPVITVSSAPSIIQTNENAEIYAKVKDDDGSLAQDVKVHFYRQSKHPFEYKGVGGTEEDSFVCQTGASLTPSSSGTVFSASGQTGFAWANKYGTGSDWDKGDWIGDFTIECDIVSTDGNGRIVVYERYKTGALSQQFTVGVGRNKIVKNGNTYTHYINDVQQGNPVTKTMEEPFRIGLITNDGTTIKFKRFIID